MTNYTVTVMDSDRRRRRPLATYSVTCSRDAYELAAICRALDHRGQYIAIEREAPKRKELA
jgi:hypothetical protein